MADAVLQLTLDTGPDPDATEIGMLTRQLRSELLRLDLEDVEVPFSDVVPTGSKGLDVAVVGQLVAQLSPAATSLASVVSAIRAWLARGRVVRTIRIELDGDVLAVSGASSADENRLVDLFVTRHSGYGDR